MLRREVQTGRRRRVILMDSITKLARDDAGAIVVCASHGGVSSGEVALTVPLTAAFFNDAGVGKDSARIAALEMLQRAGVAAGAVSHASARIGDVEDMWNDGVISYVNREARELGFVPGSSLRAMVLEIASGDE